MMREVIAFYGKDMQLNICIEELSELIKELCKVKRGIGNLDNIAEEMADVKIIMEQLDIIFDNSDDVNKWYIKKLNRLRTRLRDDQKRLEADNENGGVYNAGLGCFTTCKIC